MDELTALQVETVAQGGRIQPTLRKKREVFGRVEIRKTAAAHNRCPFFSRQFISMLTINILPDVKFRGLRIDDETVKVKD